MTTERAVLAGGCFWGMQQLIRRFGGVVSTRGGYSGGDVKHATYRNHGTHAEAIEIIHGAGGTAVLAHPFWDMESPTRVAALVSDLDLDASGAAVGVRSHLDVEGWIRAEAELGALQRSVDARVLSQRIDDVQLRVERALEPLAQER